MSGEAPAPSGRTGSLAGRWLASAAWPVHLLLAVLLLPRAALLGEALFERDLHGLWYPRALAFADAVRAGVPPLWDLSLGFGQPGLSDPGLQALYPTTWLLALLPPWTVYTVFALAHLAFTGAGFARLARASGLRRPEALLGGAVWMLSGPFVSLVNLWHHFAGAAWMPWVVLAVHRLVRRPCPSAAVGLGVCLGLQVLAGSADMLLLTAAVAAAYCLGVMRRGPRRRLPTITATAAAGVLLALALSAGQWLPAIELASHGLRRELPTGFADRWSVPPLGLARTVLPLESGGRLAWTPDAQRQIFDSTREPFLGSLYLGVVPLALAGAAFAGRGRRMLASIAAAGLIATLAALGPHAGFADVVRATVPGAAHLRYPSKAMVVPAFACALLAAHGMAAARRFARARRIGALLALVGAAGLAAAAALLGPGLDWATGWGLLLDRDGVRGDALPWAARLAVGALIAALAGAALLQAPGRHGARSRRLVAVCAVAELWLAHYDLHPTIAPEALAARPPVLAAIDASERGRVYVYDYALVEGASASRLGREWPYAIAQPPPGFDPRPLAALAQRVYPVPPVAASWGVEGSYDIDLFGLQPLPLLGLNLSLRHAEGTPAHAKLLRLGAVRTVVALDARGFEDLVPGPDFPGLFPERIRTFRVPGALARARVVGRARALEGREALEALFDPSFDPAAEVVVSGPGAAAAAAAAREGAGSVRIQELRHDRVRVEARLERPGIVVLADAWDPGWRAWVDGREAALLQAYVAFRAVAVPAGSHVVELRYRPAAALVGLGLTTLTLVGLALAAVRRGR